MITVICNRFSEIQVQYSFNTEDRTYSTEIYLIYPINLYIKVVGLLNINLNLFNTVHVFQIH